MKNLFKIFNLIALALIVIGAIAWGTWGFFHVEILVIIFGAATARILYCIIGILGIYGVHLFVDYTKKEWRL